MIEDMTLSYICLTCSKKLQSWVELAMQEYSFKKQWLISQCEVNKLCSRHWGAVALRRCSHGYEGRVTHWLTTWSWGLKVGIPGGALPSSLPFLFYSRLLCNRHWIASINRLPSWGFVVCARLKQGAIKWTPTKEGQRFRCLLGDHSFVLNYMLNFLLNRVLYLLRFC